MDASLPQNQAPRVSGVALTGLDLALARFVGKPAEIFHACGIPMRCIGQEDCNVPLSAYVAFYETIQREFDARSFGAQFGTMTRPKNAGLLGYLAINAPTLSQALSDFQRYLPIILQGFTVDISSTVEDHCLLCFSLIKPHSEAAPQINEQGLSWLTNIIRTVLRRRRWRPLQLQLNHEQPAHKAILVRNFGENVHFNCPVNALVMNRADLHQRNTFADPRLYRLLRHQAEQTLSGAPMALKGIEWIEFNLQQLILAGTPTLASLARQLNTTARKLQLTLKQENTHFSYVLDRARLHMASERLKHSDRNISEIALLLGYSETAAFSHAFKRQTGLTPRAFRQSERLLP